MWLGFAFKCGKKGIRKLKQIILFAVVTSKCSDMKIKRVKNHPQPDGMGVDAEII